MKNSILICLMLVGCSPVTEEVDQPDLVWETLSDGSRVAFSGNERAAARCWDDFCLTALNLTRSHSHLKVSGTTFTPDKNVSDMALDGGPIECSLFEGRYTETIRKDGRAVLTSERPLSKAYVTKFMADNKINGRWFNCAGILDVIEHGSLASLGTTLVGMPPM